MYKSMRVYRHRYKVLSGTYSGLVTDGVQIGYQDYPDQFQKENMTFDQIRDIQKAKQDQGLFEGIWLELVQQPLYRPVRKLGTQPKVDITDEGVTYNDIYMDLCVPFDRYGNEIHVGDTVMVASKNEVRRAVVTKIASKPNMASYGIMQRKLTVRDELEQQTLTIADSRATVVIERNTI